ncbi:MAG TPA: triple tyrosine motif-containing protein [Bacteroidales bacterium]|nr:triple tyrosine motif-containing protein [Bacteroidales bacterium]
MKTRNLILLLLLLSCRLSAQEFLPIVTQFSKNDYFASNQNWSIGQAKDGTMYFGNNQGLLQFDGSIWEVHKMPANKRVRSLMVAPDQRIYVGSFEEFGYFERDETNQLRYTSLSALLKNYDMLNDEIWTILYWNNRIIFQSFTSYFVLENGQVKGYRCPFNFLFFNKVGQTILTHTDQYGFSSVDPLKNKITPVLEKRLDNPIIAVLPLNQSTMLLATNSDGLYLYDGKSCTRFKTDVDEELKKAEINRAIRAPNGTILIGTILNGVTAIDQNGHQLWTLNTGNILQNNTVLGMYCDQENNLWLALDKGITMVRLTGSIRYIPSFHPSIGSIYSLKQKGDEIYIGSNQGLYKAKRSADGRSIQSLQLESDIKGQVWNLSEFNDQLFCGNNEETFEVGSGKPTIVGPVKGGMCMQKGTINGKEVLIQGTYTSLSLYTKPNGKWKFSHVIQNFLNPVRSLEIDYTGTIWASHLYEGMYAIHLTSNLKKAENIQVFRSLDGKHQYPIHVLMLNSRVVFADKTGLYTFDDIRKRIIPYKEMNDQLGYFSHAYRICPFRNNLYWFIRDEEAALFRVDGSRVSLIDVVPYALFQNQTVDDYQNIVPLTENSCLFLLENGLALYNLPPDKDKKGAVRLMFRSILSSDAESKDNDFLPISDSVNSSIPFRQNNFTFTVFYPRFGQMSDVHFRYKLEGLDIVWSEPSIITEKTYNYLPWGDYTFKAEALTKSGIVLSTTSYTFTIKPPFYWSIEARILYLILLAGLLYGIFRYIQHLFHDKKLKIERVEEARRLHEIEQREQKIVALQNEKLENELTVKSKELAASTISLIKKNELLANIKVELTNQKKILGAVYPNKYYEKLVRILNENLSSEDDWSIFQTNFDRIHENFFRNLHSSFPELTSNDLRFCAYLRLNLTSKDIAHLMNISLKGVELARYRIRKKIGIPSTKSLTEFMIEFK